MLLGYTYACLTTFLLGVYGLFVKNLYNNDLSGEIIFFSLSFFALLINIIVLFIKNKAPISELKIDNKNLLLAVFNGGCLWLFLTVLFSLIAFKYIDNGIQRAIVYSSPIYIILIQKLFFHKKINIYETISAFLIIVGLCFIIKKININNNTNILLGIIFANLAAFCSSFYSVISENIQKTIKDEVYWIYAYSTACILTIVLLAFKNQMSDFSHLLNYKVIFSLLFCSIIGSFLPFKLFLKAIATLGATKANIILALTPIIALISGIVFLKESITIIQLFGFIFIIIASIICNKK